VLSSPWPLSKRRQIRRSVSSTISWSRSPVGMSNRVVLPANRSRPAGVPLALLRATAPQPIPWSASSLVATSSPPSRTGPRFEGSTRAHHPWLPFVATIAWCNASIWSSWAAAQPRGHFLGDAPMPRNEPPRSGIGPPHPDLPRRSCSLGYRLLRSESSPALCEVRTRHGHPNPVLLNKSSIIRERAGKSQQGVCARGLSPKGGPHSAWVRRDVVRGDTPGCTLHPTVGGAIVRTTRGRDGQLGRRAGCCHRKPYGRGARRGTVNLRVHWAVRAVRGQLKPRRRRCSGHRRGAGDRPPGGEALGSGLAIGFGGQAVAARAEVTGNRAVRGEEPLRMPRRFEPAHASLAFARGLVRILGPVVQSPVLPVLDAREDLALGRPVTRELVGDDHPRDILQALEQLTEELLRGLPCSGGSGPGYRARSRPGPRLAASSAGRH
jgi:hypothetical protein